MVHGNFPGGGFSGFYKADEPIKMRKRGFVPVKEWLPDDSDEGVEEQERLLTYEEEEEEEEEEPVLSDEDEPEEIEEPVRWKAKRKASPKVKKKRGKKFSFKKRAGKEADEKLAEEEIPLLKKRVPVKKEVKKSKKVKSVRRKKVKTEDVDSEDYPESIDAETSEPEKVKSVRRIKVKTADVYSEDYPESIEAEASEPGKVKLVRRRKKDVYPEDYSSESIEAKAMPKEDDEDEDEIVEEQYQLPADEPSEDYPDISAEDSDLRFKFRKMRRIPTYTYLKRKRSVLRFCCPCLYRLLHSRRAQYRGLKAMFGFPIGALFGIALYWMVLDRLGASHTLCWVLGTCFGVGFAISTQVRCICFLSIPACCGRAGRGFISTYVIAYIITGPLANILLNASESMRVISCTASLNLNHSVERFNLMFQPVKEIVLDFVGAGDKVQEDTQLLEGTFDEIEKEVRDENEVKENLADTEELDGELGEKSRADILKTKFKIKGKNPGFGEVSDKKYGLKSESRCEGVFTKGVRGCYDSFQKAYDRCLSYLPIIGYLLCWPMKLTFICDLASSLMGKRSCDSDDAMNPGFGASVDTADGVQSEFEKDFAVQLQYKLTIPVENVNQLVPEDVSGAMKYSFERRKKNLDFYTQIINRILAIMCLMVLNASRKYCNQYLRIIQFDNKYVTSYFRHIDARRRKKDKMVLLPLKKAEKVELSLPFAVKFNAEEKVMLIVNCVRLISEMLSVSILLLFDRVFYEFLGLIRRHAHVTYKQTGMHKISMTIYGDGFVGNMVRGILKGFDKRHTADQVTTTEACLPLPTKISRVLIIRIYLIFLLMLVLIILESYTLRLRRVICSFFYPKREKKRIIFLYNDRLKKRRSFLQHMRHQVRKQAREQAIALDSGVFFSLRKFYPKYFDWVAKLGLGLRQCLICTEKESKKCGMIDCPDPECPFSYCSVCLQDTEGTCYACLPDDDSEPSADSISDDEPEKLF